MLALDMVREQVVEINLVSSTCTECVYNFILIALKLPTQKIGTKQVPYGYKVSVVRPALFVNKKRNH